MGGIDSFTFYQFSAYFDIYFADTKSNRKGRIPVVNVEKFIQYQLIKVFLHFERKHIHLRQEMFKITNYSVLIVEESNGTNYTNA